ncbi:hypothetical protein B0H17DRAFT_1213476 [Mycena rosella]|uniref:Uncharacterized protein n=1 Tax=Mycena rosella TaxID=1033263 RepID=A0AAD7CQ10_MYCRO|nr:hypothetical protein B0H17DRAFT_1213476 [Mycena rosella]
MRAGLGALVEQSEHKRDRWFTAVDCVCVASSAARCTNPCRTLFAHGSPRLQSRNIIVLGLDTIYEKLEYSIADGETAGEGGNCVEC